MHSLIWAENKGRPEDMHLSMTINDSEKEVQLEWSHDNVPMFVGKGTSRTAGSKFTT